MPRAARERSKPTGRDVLCHGDCLEIVPRLIGRESDRFDLVYVDPPFNTGIRHRARERRGSRASGARAYDDSWGGIDEFVAMLEPRLEVLRDALSPCGSLWLHLDHRGVHEAKLVADRVFSRARFMGEIIWIPGNGARRRKGPAVTHQTILVYARTGKMIWNADDPMLREPFAQTSLGMHFNRQDAEGRHYREREINGRVYRYYADAGRQIGSVWADCPAMRANTPLNREATGYPTQKPERLLERILRAASVADSRVLDPMCGSGTTLAVAKRLGRRWAGIDQSPVAVRTAARRLGISAAAAK